MKLNLSEPFLVPYKKVEELQKHKRYVAAFIFGSVARGEQNKNSDLDVIVITNKDNDCKEINHPIINGIKLDITFRSFKQIEKDNMEVVEKGKRIPMIAESIIVFDKTGETTKLRNKLKKTKRKKATKKDFQFMQFLIYHADNKAKRNLEKDKHSSLLSMNIYVNEILDFHYYINGKWWLSNKRLLPDLRGWDPKLAKLLEKFVITNDVKTKYKYWSKILDYVAKPLGGRKKIYEISCNCEICKKDLGILTN